MLLLAGCTGPRDLPGPDAAAHYDQAFEEVTASVGADDLGLTPRSAPLVQTEGGDCVYDPGVWEADAESFTADEDSWQPRLDTLNEILAGHGFSEVREFDYVSGEGFGFSVEDAHGLQLRVLTPEGRTEVRMHGALIDAADGCSAGVLGV